MACNTKNETITLLLLDFFHSLNPWYYGTEALELAYTNQLFSTVKALLGTPTTYLSSVALSRAIQKEDMGIARLLIYDNRMPLHSFSLLEDCCNKGLVEFVQVILNDPKSTPLIGNSVFQHSAILQLFINCPKVNIKLLFEHACTQGFIEATATILKTKKVLFKELGFYNACKAGNLQIVKLLLLDSKLNPNQIVNLSFPLLETINNGSFEVFNLLLSDSRVDPTLNNNQCLYSAVSLSTSLKEKYMQLLLADKRVVELLNSKATQEQFVVRVKSRHIASAIFLIKTITIDWEESDALQFICEHFYDKNVLKAILRSSIKVNLFNGLLLRTIGKLGSKSLLKMICKRPEIEINDALLFKESYKKMTYPSLLFLSQQPKTSLSTMHLIRCHIVKQCMYLKLCIN